MTHDKVGEQVAARIRELREDRGLSVRELARRAGLRPESVSRSERRVTEITITALAKLCVGLEVDLPTFFEFARAAPEPGVQSVELRRGLKLLSRLTPQERRRAVGGLEVLFEAVPEYRMVTDDIPLPRVADTTLSYGVPEKPSRRLKKRRRR